MEKERYLKNLKILSKLAKNKKNTTTRKINIGKNLIKSMQGMGCHPEKFLHLPTNKPFSLSIDNSVITTLGTKKIGQGTFGQVYLGCVDKECKKKVAIKIVINEDISHEYKIGKRLHQYGSIRPYVIEKCNNVTFMYSEYANNGTLRSFLRDNKKNLLPIHFRTIITQILHNLYRIQKKYPTFRHHDLHADNILINNTSPSRVKLLKVYNSTLKVHDIGLQTLITDFGLSTMKGIKNKEADDPHYKRTSGIYRESHPMYDIQYFLNVMRQEIKIMGVQSGVEALQFIERILPSDYLGKETNKLKDHRLRPSPLGHPQLPTFKEIFNDRYFSPYKKTTVPFDISTIIGKRNSSKPKPIVVKHGGGKVKKTLEQVKKELASKNNKKIIKRPGIRIARPSPQSQPKIKVSMTDKGYIRLGTRKCSSYKKSDIEKMAKTLGVNTQNKTIAKICKDIQLKYIK
jgi:serine/threonine protein kinase